MDADAAATGPVEDVALPPAAAALLWTTVATAAAAFALATVRLEAAHVDWAAFAVLAAAAAAAHRISAKPAQGWSFTPTSVFAVAAVLLLPAGAAVAAVLCGFALAYRLARLQVREHAFNSANYVLAMLAAAGARHLLAGTDAALADAAACAAFVATLHGLLGAMLRLAEGRPIRRARILEPTVLATAFGLASLGVVAAVAWEQDPWLILFAFAPLVVVYQALTLPRLVEESALDPKTQLYNARRFSQALAELSTRARRERAPLAVVMADLDFLREINNTHGHIAGDVVLSGVAEVIRANVRADDFAARFGGEEFAILLPDTGVETALEIAERIRAAVEASEFHVDTSPEPIRATISVGVACYPRDALDPQALLHAADVGLYAAKGRGRNRVVYAGS